VIGGWSRSRVLEQGLWENLVIKCRCFNLKAIGWTLGTSDGQASTLAHS
jgi:hypothetical protein